MQRISFQLVLRRMAALAMGAAAVIAAAPVGALAAANPGLPFYGYGSIVPVPSPAIVNETTVTTVTVSNDGDAPATNVQVKLSYNDWGVTFSGWQQIGTLPIASIPAAGSADVVFNNIFTNATHTCLEALITAADVNGNTGDDRGQINLEVINGGSTTSYDVPVRNRGDGPLVLNVGGNCDAGGIPGVVCKAPAVVGLPLAPGAEERVPVEVEFPPGTPRGAEVVIIVDAEDPAHPGDVNYKNHVQMVFRFETARGLKQDAVDTLTAYVGTLGDPKLEKMLAKAIEKIQKALDSTAWTDDSTVMAKGGAAIIGTELSAIKLLGKLAGKLTGATRAAIDAKIAELVDAERIIASSAIEAVGGNAGAEAEREAGDAERELGAPVKAVKHHKKAWKLAIKAAL
ncbi:MAG: hypothetical protein HY899_06015 [Deltaproteobacteria bacterium]|nr:hypothetical protein [Deltaproteobacteria bacterium]